MSAERAVVLEARGVTKRFGGLTAVSEVDLLVHDRGQQERGVGR